MSNERHPRRTPQTLQMEATECGAASLAMILAFHGCHVSLAELRAACHISREGSRASDLLRAGRSYGLTARGWRAKRAGLAGVPLPAILFWNENHFIVLEAWGREQKRAWINDPALGHRYVSEEELCSSFSEVVLTFSPGPEFQPRGVPPGIVTESFREMGRERSAVLYLALLGLLLVGPSLAVPVAMRIFVDEYYLNGESHWLWPLLGLMTIATAFQIGLTYHLRCFLLRWEMQMAERESALLLGRLQTLPASERLARGPTELATRLPLAAENARLLYREWATWLAFLPVAVASFVWMSSCGWKLAFLTLLLLGGTLWMSKGRGGLRREREAAADVARRRFSNAVFLGFSLPESLKFGGQSGFLRRIAPLREHLFAGEQSVSLGRLDDRILSRLQGGIVFAGIITIGAWEVMEGRLTVGALFAFLVLWVPLNRWVLQVFKMDRVLHQWGVNRRRIADLESPAKAEEPATPIDHFRQLEMQQVAFHYSRAGNPLLEQLDIRLTPRKRVSVVGASGSGKTTLTRLLMGLLSPTEGEVSLNGMRVTPELFGEIGAWSDGEPLFLAKTGGDHLRMGRESLTSAEVEAALRKVGLSAEWSKRSLSAGAENLSGGERQRLEMARLLARLPELVILDEATNEMDEEAELQVLEAWQREGCAWLWVTHRWEIIRRSDEVWVLDEGKIVDRGTWEELLCQSRRFREVLGL